MPGISDSRDVLQHEDELIPDAAAMAEEYLRQIAKLLKAESVPVAMDVVPIKFGGWRDPKVDCLQLLPTEKRLHRFEMLHYAMPIGTSSALRVGYYVLGGIAAQGLGGYAIAGGSRQRDGDTLASLIELIDECAVMPAMDFIARKAQGGEKSGGFFGT